ncbi:hypothetical protein CPC08DRAFT_424639 [Agrocybe pediades]|nr:hypothetical protein CPC08DRAFT_424639 [Agrocybe pediades]
MRSYPTCGFTCAAKLQELTKHGMCEHCRTRPKLLLGGKLYPHCGRTCRDNAALEAAIAKSSTCSSCIVCWMAVAPSSPDTSDFCSDTCRLAVEDLAPLLIELPRGHKAFHKVETVYNDTWKQSQVAENSPRIKRIYMILMKPQSVTDHKQYRTRIGSQTSSSQHKKTNDKERAWIGISGSCEFGSPGVMQPCHSEKCFLCTIVRSTFSVDNFPRGIISTLYLPRAIEQAFKYTGKVRHILLADVVLGKVEEEGGIFRSLPKRLYDSVKCSQGNKYRKTDNQEYAVFESAAVHPKYLINLAE